MTFLLQAAVVIFYLFSAMFGRRPPMGKNLLLLGPLGRLGENLNLLMSFPPTFPRIKPE
jgi:hypothetical protein